MSMPNDLSCDVSMCVETYPMPVGTVTAWCSSGGEDIQWDSFLESTRAGRHEQSSLWGQVKSLSGWRSLRYVFKIDEKIVAGFQALWRQLGPFGNIAYISKGPVIALDSPALRDLVVGKIQEMARSRRFKGVLVQSASSEDGLTAFMARRGFLPYFRRDVIRATAEVDLSREEAELLQSMRKSKRKNIRRGLRSKISVDEGGESELSIFFELMLQTCKRRGVRPNPANVDILKAIWRMYHPRGWLRLFFATYDAEYVSGSLIVTFGDRAFFWKTGWSGLYRECRPNDILDWAGIQWAKAKGYRFVDFCGIDPLVAKAIAQTKQLPSRLQKTPTFYTLGYGVRQVALPDPQVYIDNRLARRIYGLLCAVSTHN